MVLTADEGKAPMVPEDPIIEAVRRMIMGGVPMIRKGGQAASGQVAPHLPAKVRPKRNGTAIHIPTRFSWQATKTESSFDHYGDPEVDHMVSMWKLVRKEESELFAGSPKRFKVIPNPRLGSELMEAERSSDLNYDYIATLINEEHTDVRIEAAKKSMILRKHMDSGLCMLLI